MGVNERFPGSLTQTSQRGNDRHAAVKDDTVANQAIQPIAPCGLNGYGYRCATSITGYFLLKSSDLTPEPGSAVRTADSKTLLENTTVRQPLDHPEQFRGG